LGTRIAFGVSQRIVNLGALRIGHFQDCRKIARAQAFHAAERRASPWGRPELFCFRARIDFQGLLQCPDCKKCSFFTNATAKTDASIQNNSSLPIDLRPSSVAG
jgi:hypothetical protein